ncbi:hypothetical protein FPRO05_08330 [Fusarium proliferatum]|nr:hypothetical protein FPRO05_08330 [Fusarium proliferatum]
MVLAIGALSTSETDTAETLLIHAKREVALFDDVATLPIVQFCLLMSDYQLNMGRPNAAYLQVCSASTRAMAMGLHARAEDDVGREDLQTRLTTLWATYFQQTWICFIVGRKGIIRRSDISCDYPDNQPMLVDLCNLAAIQEQATSCPNGQKYCTLSQMYENTRKLHLQVWGVCEDLWFGPSPLRCQGSGADEMARLLVCNGVYLDHATRRENLELNDKFTATSFILFIDHSLLQSRHSELLVSWKEPMPFGFDKRVDMLQTPLKTRLSLLIKYSKLQIPKE